MLATYRSQLAGALAHPGLANFNVVVIAAGLCPSDISGLEKLLQPQHCKLISVATASDLHITEAFETALTHIRQLILQHSNGDQQNITLTGTRHDAKQFDGKVQKTLEANFLQLSVADAKQLGTKLTASSNQQDGNNHRHSLNGQKQQSQGGSHSHSRGSSSQGGSHSQRSSSRRSQS
jgi:hypothetical protein